MEHTSWQNIIKQIFYPAVIGCIIYLLYLSATLVLHQDLGFNTDLARDFLLLQDMQQTHKPPLIGPRSGGIPGVFHGPLWLYLNFPAFFLSHGDPIGVGWFWIVLIAILTGICFFIGKQLYGTTVGFLSALLIACASIPFAGTLFNPFGAVLFSPIFLYFFSTYIQTNKYKYLLLALFILGLIIQFQIAFGGPLLLLSMLYLLPTMIKRNTWKHISTFFILIIPLATYFLFDIRHDFLQFRALLSYIAGNGNEVKDFTLINMFQNRLSGFMLTLMPIPYPTKSILFSIGFFFIYLFSQLFKKMKDTTYIFLFFYFYFGYWIITFFFRGVVWSYYYWPFLSIVVILIAAGYKYLPRFVFIIFYSIVFMGTYMYSYQYIQGITPTVGKDGGSWLFNYNLAKTVFQQKDKQFGYYPFSPDEFSYSLRYAMDYTSKGYATIAVSPYKKESITYLLIAPGEGENKQQAGNWWRENRIKITKKPTRTWKFENGFRLEKYYLSEEEKNIPADPNLINSIIFR